MTPKTQSILSVDFGSTSIKVARFTKNSEGTIKKSSEEPWIDYIPDTSFDSEGHAFNYLSWEHVNALLHKLHTQVTSITDGKPHEMLVVISGMTHDLAVRYASKTILLLDDPSIGTYLTPEEYIILSRTFGTSDLNATSTLMKILSIKNHPEILPKLFGQHVSFENLSFATILGVVAQTVTQDRILYSVPIDDIRAFANRTLTPGQMNRLLTELGVSPDQLVIANGRFERSGRFSVYCINDFHAETITIRHLIDSGQIPKHAIVCAFDTVGKLMGDIPTLPKTMGGLSYMTMRNCARVVKTWIASVLSLPLETQLYERVDRILLNHDEPEFIFYPMTPENPDGILIDQRGKKITLDDIRTTKLSKNDIEDCITAIAYGVGLEFRRMITSVWNDNSLSTTPIVIYGGLLSNHQTGWPTILSVTLPTSVHGLWTLPMTSGSIGSVYAALSDIDSTHTTNIPMTVKPLQNKKHVSDLYLSLWNKNNPR